MKKKLQWFRCTFRANKPVIINNESVSKTVCMNFRERNGDFEEE